MSTHRLIDRICWAVLALTVLLAALFVNGESLGLKAASSHNDYQSRLFDTSSVHTIDIVMDNWEDFLANCRSEEYYACTLVIDGHPSKNVAIRGKGNTSLSQVEAYGNDRYSFKVEFDHYDSSNTYYGLDKLCLNNIIQDNTFLKDYLTYQLMNQMGVAAPLCSFAYITVNGEDWGLYLAVEGVEEAFLRRNYGNDYGALYKPDSLSMGGGRGNGRGFDMEDFLADMDNLPAPAQLSQDALPGNMQPPEGTGPSADGESSPSSSPHDRGRQSGGRGFAMGSDDVLLRYIDDDPDSYANIFDSAKTPITDGDKARLIASLKKLSALEDIPDVVDTEAVIRYFVVHNFVLNFDSYTGSMVHNYYLYEKDGRLQMLPWDYNLAFGGFESGADATDLVNYPIDSPVSGGDASDRPMIGWIFQSEEYTALYHDLFSQFIADCFESGYFEAMLDEVIALISPYVQKDPTKFCTYDEFLTGSATLREFCLLRAQSIRGQLSGTIGSTDSTRQPATLIDAGDIQLSAMGSMGGGNGGHGFDGQRQQDGFPDMPPEMHTGDDAQYSPPDIPAQQGFAPEGEALPDDGGHGRADFHPGQQAEATPSAYSQWVWLLGCCGVLIFGLIFALCFRRR